MTLLLEIIARILQALMFVMDVLNGIGNLFDVGRLVATGRTDQTPRIRVPADPKPLSPAAERALAEAEARREARESTGSDATN